MNALYRDIPKVDIIMDQLPDSIFQKIDRHFIKMSIAKTLDQIRSEIGSGLLTSLDDAYVVNRVLSELNRLVESTLKRVVNGTGIVLHTNMGRAVISRAVVNDVIPVFSHYSTLEYSVETGKRGLRYDHIADKICMLTGAEAAIVVNNNAAAVMLILNSLVQDKEVIVSRGELVEIGGSFRVPDVMRASGCKLIEVGTTNKTRIKDYSEAITESTGMIMKVHTSNYKVVGFTETVELSELCDLSKKTDIVLYEDIGSGLLYDYFNHPFHEEPTVFESILKDVDIVSFSGDKLMGGAQAGFIVGKQKYIDAISNNPLLRAFRIDKFSLAILERTLTEYFKPKNLEKDIPTIARLSEDKESVRIRIEGFLNAYKPMLDSLSLSYRVVDTKSEVGGGSMPLVVLSSYALCLDSLDSPSKIQQKLRAYKTPIVTMVNNNELRIDFKTIDEDDFSLLAEGLRFVLSGECL